MPLTPQALLDQADKCVLEGVLLRLVESQEEVATLELVGSLDEQMLLEEILEESKPPLAEESGDLAYLLSTPFRYPPLKWGSRYGRRHERGIFYGASEQATLFAEAGYYRFVFWDGMEEPLPKGKLLTQHMAFEAEYAGEGYDMTRPPFDQAQQALVHPSEYAFTQALGSAMREERAQLFVYPSARCRAGGTNVGLFTPRALRSKSVGACSRWICETTAERVSFSSKKRGQGNIIAQFSSYQFYRDEFSVDGKLPSPA